MLDAHQALELGRHFSVLVLREGRCFPKFCSGCGGRFVFLLQGGIHHENDITKRNHKKTNEAKNYLPYWTTTVSFFGFAVHISSD